MSQQLLHLLQNKQHVIWDWNGTLFNDIEHTVNTINQVLSEYELPTICRDSYRAVFEFPVKTYYEKLGFDFNRHDFETVAHRFVDIYMTGYQDYPLVAGMKDILETIHQTIKKQSILSAAEQTDLDNAVNHFEIRHLFEHVMGIENKMAASKIHKGQELIKISGVNKDNAILIGDTTHDLEVGNALGIDVILVAHGHQNVERLTAAHDKVIHVDDHIHR